MRSAASDNPAEAAAAAEAERLEAIRLKAEAQMIAAANEKTLWESGWCVRYPIAALICWGAVALGQNGHPWMCGAAVLLAATVAYELSALLIVLGVGHLLYQGIAGLPVSVAIVIGAFIIASIIRK